MMNLDKWACKLIKMYGMGGVKRRIAKILRHFMNVIHSCDIPLTCIIGDGVHFAHRGIGVVIHDKAFIGDEVEIMQNVTIGGKDGGSPHICNRVSIGTGAVILGGIVIGEHSVIGANSVVIKDVEPYSVIAGIPGKLLYKKDETKL